MKLSIEKLVKILYPRLAKIAFRFIELEKTNVSLNSRVIENSYVISKLAKLKKGKILDIGCSGRTNTALVTNVLTGWEVYGIE